LTLRNLLCPALLSLLLIATQALPSAQQLFLEYRYSDIAEGQLWRLVSSQLIHMGWRHMFMNLLGFWLIWELFVRNRTSAGYCLFMLLFLLLGTTAGLYLLNPELSWYRGLSGALHGLIIWGIIHTYSRQPAIMTLLLGLIALKLIWEQVYGPLPGSEENVRGRIIVDSHLYGGLSGLLLWQMETVYSQVKSRWRSKSNIL
jgi:rhomboid family GlyGly-CTERM serine protease